MKRILTILLFLIVVLKTEAQSSVFKVVDSLLLKGNYQNAFVILNEQPPSIKIYDKTASIYQTIGDYNNAIKYYKKALEIQEKESVKVKLGNVYNAAGLTNKAVSIFENIIEKDSSNLLVLNNLGKLYLAKNKPKSAEKIYSFLKTKDSLNPSYPYQLAKSFQKQKKMLKMGQSYLDAYNIDPLHLKSIYELSKFFKELRYKDSTMLFIDKGLKIDSLNINFLQLKANELYFTKVFDETIPYLKKLDSLNFKSINIYEMYGMCFYNLENFEMAEMYFKKALTIDRQNPVIYYRLASLHYELENIKLAKLYLYQSLGYGKGDLYKQYYLRGIIAKDEKELKKAVENFEKSYSYNHKNHKALFELALASDIYFKDKKIALRHFQKFIEKFKSKDELMTNYSNQRIDEIKKQFFIEGEIIE